MFDNYEKPEWDEQASHYYPTHPQKKGLSNGKIIALTLVCSLLAGSLGAGAVYFLADRNSSKIDSYVHKSNRDTDIEQLPVAVGEEMTPAQVYAQNVNSTVGITTSVTTNYWGYQTTAAASGSGFILTADGYVLTNYHVVEGSDSISVSSFDGTSYDAQLVGFDASRDIAVLKIDGTDLVPVVLGNSDAMRVGDPVVAIGNPLGELTFSLTAGAVSAMDRTVTLQTGATMNLLQTDCAINSGNSGGALFNLYGEVIGITNAKYSSSSNAEASIDNIGFAIPINDIEKMVISIIENGYYAKPYIGISVTDVSPETQSYGLPQGAAVRHIAENSPAQEAGLQVNDIITKINNAEITGSTQLVSMVGECDPDDRITLTVYRSGEILEITVTVGQQIQTTTPSNSSLYR